MSLNKLYCRRNFIDQANLLENANADDPVENGWQIRNGTWQRKSTDPLPLIGDHYFYATDSCDAEIYQDVSIVNDFYNQYYLLTMQVRNKEGYDTSEAVVEFHDSCSIKKTYKTGRFNDEIGWQYIDMFMVRKSHANKMRVRLISKRNKGIENNGYTDEILVYKVNAKNVRYHVFNENSFSETDLRLNYEIVDLTSKDFMEFPFIKRSNDVKLNDLIFRDIHETKSNWQIRDEFLVQCSNFGDILLLKSMNEEIQDVPIGKGTQFILKSKMYGSRFVVQTSLKSTDNGSVGIIFSKVDDFNYYSVLLSYGSEENKLFLVKYTNESDNPLLLGQIDLPNLIKDHFHSLRVEKYDDEINVFLNGIKYIKENNTGFECGYVGLVSINNMNSKFRYLFAGNN